MFKISEMSKRAVSPEFAETRAACGGLAIFAATLVALGMLASLVAGMDLSSITSNGDPIPAAYVQANQTGQ